MCVSGSHGQGILKNRVKVGANLESDFWVSESDTNEKVF
jgi:hypothetical protein